MKKLVIVESPTKARTITKFLGKDYTVDSCMGHVRDLPQSAKDIPANVKSEKWSRLGVDVAHDFEPLYVIPSNKKKIVSRLRAEIKDSDELYLATDEDREGESISWHLTEVLKPKIPLHRLVFHEITKEAIEESLRHPRAIDLDLVRAQEARRILDRLVGYGLSPVLWQKIAFGLSAGRVQSVAVRLICERELERMKFKKADYLGIGANLSKDKAPFTAQLLSLSGKSVATGKDFDDATGEIIESKKNEVVLLTKETGESLLKSLPIEKWQVLEVETKPMSRTPFAPFITSTLQQDASRKFGWTSRQTMQVAQKLYEHGYITYMRTDSMMLSSQALNAARAAVTSEFGQQFLPESPRFYGAKKVKGAQEAHEAIRPAGQTFRHPRSLKLAPDQNKLYDLIWRRTLASQMKNAEVLQTRADIKAGESIFRANGSQVTSPGFLKAYQKGVDPALSEERAGQVPSEETILPSLREGDEVSCESLEIEEHETKPPARYTEASLIKVLESEGVGRPSTYASIMGTIEDRGYVRREGTTLKPTFTALIVVQLLKTYFPDYVDTGFTSEMETSLDAIADGEKDYLDYLKGFYLSSEGLENQIKVQEAKIEPEEARSITFESLPGFVFKVGRYGAYVCRPDGKEEICASVPEDSAPADVTVDLLEMMLKSKKEGGDSIGRDPETGERIVLLTGRYGPYVQLGELKENSEQGMQNAEERSQKVKGKKMQGQKKEKKPKRASIPKGIKPEELTLDQALLLLSLPKSLGVDSKSGLEIKVGNGRFGPYVVREGDYRSLRGEDTLFNVTLDRALELLAIPKKGRGRRGGKSSKPLKELGNHPKDNKPVVVKDGRYGPYVSWGKVNASLPKEASPDEMTLEKALELLEKKSSKN